MRNLVPSKMKALRMNFFRDYAHYVSKKLRKVFFFLSSV